jgi:hypothetical protein
VQRNVLTFMAELFTEREYTEEIWGDFLTVVLQGVFLKTNYEKTFIANLAKKTLENAA